MPECVSLETALCKMAKAVGKTILGDSADVNVLELSANDVEVYAVYNETDITVIFVMGKNPLSIQSMYPAFSYRLLMERFHRIVVQGVALDDSTRYTLKATMYIDVK